MTEDISNHLADIIVDINRVKAAAFNDERESRLTEDDLKNRLCDVSNALDDIYNDIVGI